MFKRYDSNILAIWWRNIDKIIFTFSIALLMSGNIFNFFSTSTIPSEKLYDSKYILFYKHFFFSIAGFFILILFSLIKNNKIKIYTFAGFVFFSSLLVLVYFFGIDVKGSKRWLNIFFFRIQPVEFVKPFFILAIASILSLIKYPYSYRFLFSVPVVVLISFFLLIQPDYSQTLLVITIWMIMIFISGISLIFISILALSIVTIMVSVVFFFKDKFFYIFDRILLWINKAEISYQSEQALNAIKSGSFFGRGIGEGILKEKVPEAHTDYVMSVIAEEYGILTVLIIILLTFFLVIRIFSLSNLSKNSFNKLSLMGISSLLIIQSFINLGVTINILPSTGMPFPFISYGGSSIIGSSIAIGLALALSRKDIS